jgi:hypothetical protein
MLFSFIGIIEAEDYYKASGISKIENNENGFSITNVENGDYLIFPNIKGLENKSKIKFSAKKVKEVTIEIHDDFTFHSICGIVLSFVFNTKIRNTKSKTQHPFYTQWNDPAFLNSISIPRF